MGSWDTCSNPHIQEAGRGQASGSHTPLTQSTRCSPSRPHVPKGQWRVSAHTRSADYRKLKDADVTGVRLKTKQKQNLGFCSFGGLSCVCLRITEYVCVLLWLQRAWLLFIFVIAGSNLFYTIFHPEWVAQLMKRAGPGCQKMHTSQSCY